MSARLSRDTLLLLISNVGSAALLFVLSALIGRALGSDGLGVYAVALAWVYPLSLLVDFGLATLLTRDIAQQPEKMSDYVATTVAARLLMGGAVMLLLFIGAPLVSADPVIVMGLRVSAPLVLVLPLFSTFTAVFRARGSMTPIPLLNIGMLAVQVAFTIWVFVSGGSVLDVLAVNMLTSVGQAAAAWWIYKRYFAVPPKQDSAVEVQRAAPLQHTVFTILPLLRQALPFALAALFAALQLRLSLLLLERFASPAEAGYYTAASRFVEVGRMFPNAFFGALFPALSLLAADHRKMTRTFRRAGWVLAAFGLLTGVGFTLAAPLLLSLVYGADFNAAAPTLAILGWSLGFGVLRGVRTLYWYALKREQYVNRVNGAVIILQLALGVWLVQEHGALGAAVGFLAVEAVALVLLWREIRFSRIIMRKAHPRSASKAAPG